LGAVVRIEQVGMRRMLLMHALANVLIQSIWFGISTIMAVLARKRFGADDWQTLMITAAAPTLMVLSVFWNHLLSRMTIRRFLVFNWVFTMWPLACAAFAQNFWQLLVCHVLASIGAAGWSPISGTLLKRFYGDHMRGRAFGAINSAMYVGMIAASYGIGRALDVNENSFRIYLPAAAGAYGVGVWLLRRLIVLKGGDEIAEERVVSERMNLRRLLAPVLHMREVLAEDRVFYQYEAAFMTYGVGWMICNALLPVLATDRLHMNYAEFAGSTQVVYPLCMLLMTYPMGWLMDHIGPMRTSLLSFAWLTFYPLGLMVSHSVVAVGISTVVYGIAMAGVQMTWMLGPVSLAPSPQKVPHYVAIHATLVGVRGIVAQGVGMLIYRLSGSFVVPFMVAAMGFAWASWQMSRLRVLTDSKSPAA
jgi:MFS family permease